MKIRTRLLLFLLPTLIGSIALLSLLLAYNWHEEIVEGFKNRLRTSVTSVAALVDLENTAPFEKICKELHLLNLSYTPSHPLLDSAGQTLPFVASDGTKMTAYAPVFNAEGLFVGTVTADADLHLVDQKFQKSLILVILVAGFTIALMIVTLFYIANRISQPIQKLNNSALAIAAGHYGDAALIHGPKEIAELANTLNTMSECLLENIQRFKENALLRERMYGEYECALLLQHRMLQKNIDECRSDAVAARSLTLFSDHPRGLLLDFPKLDKPNIFHIHMAEAEETGFEGMYELLTQYKHSRAIQKHTSLSFERNLSILQSQGPHLPLLWSLDDKKFLEPKEGQIKLESGDFFFLFNEGLLSFFHEERKAIQNLIGKVLKVFAQDGLETTVAMLQKELSFAAKRKEITEDIHLLCFQILNP